MCCLIFPFAALLVQIMHVPLRQRRACFGRQEKGKGNAADDTMTKRIINA